MTVSQLVETLVKAMHEGLDPDADVLMVDWLPVYVKIDKEQATVYITDENPEDIYDAQGLCRTCGLQEPTHKLDCPEV